MATPDLWNSYTEEERKEKEEEYQQKRSGARYQGKLVKHFPKNAVSSQGSDRSISLDHTWVNPNVTKK